MIDRPNKHTPPANHIELCKGEEHETSNQQRFESKFRHGSWLGFFILAALYPYQFDCFHYSGLIPNS